MDALTKQTQEEQLKEWKYEIQLNGLGENFTDSYELAISPIKSKRKLNLGAEDPAAKAELPMTLLREHSDKIHEPADAATEELAELRNRSRRGAEEMRTTFSEEDARLQGIEQEKSGKRGVVGPHRL